MKNLFLILVATFTTTIATAQTSCSNKDSISGVDLYVSAGISMSNSKNDDTLRFSQTSYPSVEFGFMKNNFIFGLIAGRGNFERTEGFELINYYTEVKAAVYVPVENFNVYGLVGVGSYFSSNSFFIEYGAGFSYSFNKFGVFAQASNWDGIWYLTPGISYTF